MKQIVLFITAIVASSHAYATMDCGNLRSEIAAKIEANGVKEYSLDIIPAEEVGDQKVVGSCDGGTKKIVYTRN